MNGIKDSLKRTFSAKDIALKIFMIVFVAGMIFFFSSSIWFPAPQNYVNASPLNKIFEMESRDISIGRWDYSPEQQMMEVEINVNNKSADGINKYEFTARERNAGRLKVEKVIEEPNFIILRISEFPKRWSSISVAMNVENSNTLLRLYTNARDVTAVDRLEKLSLTEYQALHIDGVIKSYENEIKTFEKDITECLEQIENIEDNINNVESNMEYQTEAEKKNSEDIIMKNSATIGTLRETITSDQDKIAEFKKRIEMANAQKEELLNPSKDEKEDTNE